LGGLGPAVEDVPGAGDRLRALFHIAEEMGTGFSVSELVALLPNGVTDVGVRAWLKAHPDVAKFDEGLALPANGSLEHRSERRTRGELYLEAARAFVDGPMAPIRPWVESIGLTGSAAYGEPQAGDDLDFLVVARSGAVWVILAYVYILVRLGRGPRLPEGFPEACFNYVLDGPAARREFERPQGFLFAREALAVRTLYGEEYYRGLLGSATWMSAVVPKLYADRSRSPPLPPAPRAPWPVRWANAVLFPILATYLQFVGAVRNRRFVERGLPERTFAVRTRMGSMALVSSRFERLRAEYEAVGEVPFAPLVAAPAQPSPWTGPGRLGVGLAPRNELGGGHRDPGAQDLR
jgi:hypothetical protein